MIGWHISVYRQADGGSSPAAFETPEGARLAVWQTSWGGLEWIDELVKQGKAIDLGGRGYPMRYTAQARYLTGRVLAGPPKANEVWVRGPQDIVTEKWAGKTVVDRAVADACAPDEWLIVEAWDESQAWVGIRPCTLSDVDAMLAVVNAAATAYAGVIPADRYHVPYMPAAELRAELAAGVRFFGWFEGDEGGRQQGEGPGQLWGLMGIQDVDDVTLIRHAYVLPAHQGRGIGGRLLVHLMGLPQVSGSPHAGDSQGAAASPRRPLLVGTWADAVWAVRFYERHGFRLVTPAEKDRLLRRYWRIPARQVETSVVLRYGGSLTTPPGTPG